MILDQRYNCSICNKLVGRGLPFFQTDCCVLLCEKCWAAIKSILDEHGRAKQQDYYERKIRISEKREKALRQAIQEALTLMSEPNWEGMQAAVLVLEMAVRHPISNSIGLRQTRSQ